MTQEQLRTRWLPGTFMGNGLLRAAARAAPGALLANLVAERDRWVLWLPAAMGTGAALYFLLLREPDPRLAPAVFASAAAAAVFLRRHAAVLVLSLAVAAAALGFGAAQWRTQAVAAPVIEREIGPVRVTGLVLEAEQRPDDRRLTLGGLVIDGIAPEATPATVRVTVRARSEVIAPGFRVAVRAVLLPPSPPTAPGGFDFARLAWFERLGAVGYAVSAPEILAVLPPDSVGARLASLRHALSTRIRAALGGQAGAVAAALMTGDRSGIEEDTWDALRDSGLAHLLAISGLHIGLVAALLFFAVRAALAASETLALRAPIKKWAAAAAGAGAFGYLLLTGATIPTQRSFLMLSLVLLAVLLDRRPFSMRLVAWAAAVVLLTAPDSLLGPSFQMSFAAVVALIAAFELARAPLSRWRLGAGRVRRAGLYLLGVGLTTLVAGLATMPFALYHFNRIAAFGLAANLLAVPATAMWIMPWAVVAFVLMPFGLEGLALQPMGWGIDFVIGVAATVSSWPGAAYSLPAMPAAGIVLVAAGGLWLCLWRRPWRLAGLAGIALGLATTGALRPPDVLVSDDATYFAVRAADGGLWASSARSNYTVNSWLRRDGLDRARAFPRPGEQSADSRLRCDGLGCVYTADGITVALSRDERTLDDDCRAADVVLAAVAVFVPCGDAAVVDRLDLWWNGAYAVWLTPSGPRIESVADRRGGRLWVLPRQRPSRD